MQWVEDIEVLAEGPEVDALAGDSLAKVWSFQAGQLRKFVSYKLNIKDRKETVVELASKSLF